MPIASNVKFSDLNYTLKINPPRDFYNDLYNDCGLTSYDKSNLSLLDIIQNKSLHDSLNKSLYYIDKLSDDIELNEDIPPVNNITTLDGNITTAVDDTKLVNDSLKSKFKPSSLIISTTNRLLLNDDNNYTITFNNGMLDGDCITINEMGDIITFNEEGSYLFYISGEALAFSDVNVKLIYYSDKFTQDISSFTNLSIPKENNKLYLRGIPTILPLSKNQTLRIKLVPNPSESIILFEDTRLLIYRVA